MSEHRAAEVGAPEVSLRAVLRSDAARYAGLGGWREHPGFRVVAVYRFGNWVRSRHGVQRLAGWALYRLLHGACRLYNVELWAGGAEIGPGLFLIHPANVYFPSGCVVGENCTIHHEVTLGWGSKPGVPRLGANVVVFPGARLLGGITIGDDAIIGANCVVTRDVPAGHVVVPGTSRMIPRSMSSKGRELDAKAAGQA